MLGIVSGNNEIKLCVVKWIGKSSDQTFESIEISRVRTLLVGYGRDGMPNCILVFVFEIALTTVD